MSVLDKKILNEQNLKDLEKVKDIIAEEGLVWNLGSVYHTLYVEEIDLESLRVYDGKLKNIVVLIMVGLPENKRNREEAFKVLAKFSEAGIHPIRLQKFLVNILTERHFFMDTLEEALAKNLIEADTTDEILLQNLIFYLIKQEEARKTFLLATGSLNNQGNSSIEQSEQPQ